MVALVFTGRCEVLNRTENALGDFSGGARDKQEFEHDEEESAFNGIDGFIGYKDIRRSLQFGIGAAEDA